MVCLMGLPAGWLPARLLRPQAPRAAPHPGGGGCWLRCTFGQAVPGAERAMAAGGWAAQPVLTDRPAGPLRLLRGYEWRVGRVTPPAAQVCGGALTGPGERPARVAEGFADECLDLVPDIGEDLLGCGVRS